MESAKKSFKKDIDSGFEILHIDPSIDIHKAPDTKTVLFFSLRSIIMGFN